MAGIAVFAGARGKTRAPALLLGALAAGLALAAPAAAQQGAAGSETVVRIQQLEEQIRLLNGRIERLEHKLSEVARDGGARIGDLEARLLELEGLDPSILGDPAPLGALRTGANAATATGSSAAVVAVSEQTEFDAAVRMIQTGDAAGGRAELEAFRRAYPDSPLNGLAQHWIGESLFLTNDFRRAAQVYLANITEAPGNARAPESLIGLALSLEKLGQVDEACLTLSEAPRRHPNAAEALARAAAEATRLGCNG